MPVTRNDTTEPKTYDFVCPEPTGCGGDDPFRSVGWVRRKDAVTRGKQHAAEHETGEPMSELVDFNQES